LEPVRVDYLESPHPSRLDANHPLRAGILAAHVAALVSGSDTYIDPASGYDVFTAAFLAERGTCCDTGCRHCPYVGA